MKKLIGGLLFVALMFVNLTLSRESKSSTFELNSLIQNAVAGDEYTWFPDKKDRYDPIRKCYYQCIDPGDGCAYVYNYEYAC